MKFDQNYELHQFYFIFFNLYDLYNTFQTFFFFYIASMDRTIRPCLSQNFLEYNSFYIYHTIILIIQLIIIRLVIQLYSIK